jgi:hypothetical protein
MPDKSLSRAGTTGAAAGTGRHRCSQMCSFKYTTSSGKNCLAADAPALVSASAKSRDEAIKTRSSNALYWAKTNSLDSAGLPRLSFPCAWRMDCSLRAGKVEVCFCERFDPESVE